MKRRNLSLLAIIGLTAFLFGTSPTFAQISLNNAERFAILGGSDAVTAAGPAGTVIIGDVGVFPGSSITGFPPAIVLPPSDIHQTDMVAQLGQASLDAAFVAADALVCPPANDLTGLNLGGRTLTPGVYCFSSTAFLTGVVPLFLDLQGDPDAFFLFKIGSSITTGSSTSVQLLNSGGTTCPRNVFFRTIASATLGSGSTFLGNILAGASVGLDPSAQLRGRALAKVAVTLSGTNLVTRCDAAPIVACPTITLTPPPLPGGTLGAPYNTTITASGGSGSYTFALTSGALPTGLLLNPSTGVLSGTPTGAGSTFTITATDAGNPLCAGSQTYTITIGAFAGAPAGGPTLDFVGLMVLMVLLVGAGLFVMNKLSM